ncbi:hypothetical protein LIA77_08348 [Sarocladium implicatum]|nr:hypothetical protein LIA77_08348 [Sarocladium implicatum]
MSACGLAWRKGRVRCAAAETLGRCGGCPDSATLRRVASRVCRVSWDRHGDPSVASNDGGMRPGLEAMISPA